MAKLEFYMRSDKAISGGSRINIYAPRGFTLVCPYFRVRGLGATTTCAPRERGAYVEFTLDTNDPKAPMFPFWITMYASNPEFTPQPNDWSVSIIGPLGTFIDTLDDYQGFDITGSIVTRVLAAFPYKGQRNPISIEINPSTIMNQADNGNEIIVTAPDGFNFPVNCTGYRFYFSNQYQIDDRYPNAEQYNFPPEGTTCQGNGAGRLVITLPDGAGLLAPYNYTIDVTVINPKYDVNGTDKWSVLSRVNNPDMQKVVDANRSFDGFFLRDLQGNNEDISNAVSYVISALLFLHLMA